VTRRARRALGAGLATGLLVLAAAASDAQPTSLAGRLLVATEQMRDPRFHRTVIYIVRHDATGALGLIVNRPVARVAAGDLLRDLGRDDDGAHGTIRLHYGGPVSATQGFVLHTVEWKAPDTRVVDDGIAFTASALVVEAIGRGIGPRRALFALGYAGWAPRQLEAEIAADSWVTVPADEALVFDDEAATKWERAMARRKIDL
jgi:putative transcriptional regulator